MFLRDIAELPQFSFARRGIDRVVGTARLSTDPNQVLDLKTD